jgi:hypothetical protein
MIPPKRFENAIRKLYTAFHAGRLDPECCKHCAVGNVLDNNESWTHLTDHHGSLELTYVGKVNQLLGKRFKGYTPAELLAMEALFLKGCGYELPIAPGSKKPANRYAKDMQFNGLCAVVDYLCRLDGVPNVMDYSGLFDPERNQASVRQATLDQLLHCA